MRRAARTLTAAVTAFVGAAAPAFAATSWSVGLAASSGAEGQSQTWLPPTSVAATCNSAVSIDVSWPAVSHASSYEVWRSSGGAYTLRTTTASTSVTDGGLALATYTYKVKSVVGSNWTSALSTASGARNIVVGFCS